LWNFQPWHIIITGIYCYDYQVLLDNNISLKRYTQCECRPNKFGRKLLEMCKSSNLCIANSRIDKDKNIGKKTCNDLSVVDYLILSSGNIIIK
jgi:hypothetical protein